MNTQRTERIMKKMVEQGLDVLIVSDPSSIFYLTGKMLHTEERLFALGINRTGEYRLFNNELFPMPENLNVPIEWYNDTQDAVEKIAPFVGDAKVIGIDKTWPSKFLLRLQELCPGARYMNGSIAVDPVRARKDEAEKKAMRLASKLNDQAMEKLIALVPQNLTELKMTKELARIYSELGTQGFSFEPIVGYGANGADPHHVTDDSKLRDGDSIVLDIGCLKDYYCSDMTRTVFYKSASDQARKVYNTVREANEKAIALVKPGRRFCDIDAAARNHIEAAGYGKFFTHRTGHSIGIDVHEQGDVSSVNTAPVEEGMIFSIEPGIYLTGTLGVRIEDLVLVTNDGCEVLNSYDKKLTIVG